MRVILTGNTEAILRKIEWDDLPLNEKHGKILGSISRGINIDLTETDIRLAHDELIKWYGIMKIQKACIDLVTESNTDEILKIWTGIHKMGNSLLGRYHMFSPISFYPNPEVYKESLFRGSFSKIDFSQYHLDYMEWDSKQKAEIKIMPENEADILAMNQCVYDDLRYCAYHEDYHVKYVDTKLMKWAKGLRNDINEGMEKTPVSLDDYRKTYLGFIDKEIDKYQADPDVSFRQLVNEELESLKIGMDLISGKELFHDKYVRIDDEYELLGITFSTTELIYRIIAHDIAQIILDLETGKFFPDNTPPDFVKNLKHEKYQKLLAELKPQYIDKVNHWIGDKIDCARLIVTLENLDFFKSNVKPLEITKQYGVMFFGNESALKEQLKPSKRPKYSKSEVKKWKFYNVLARLEII